MLPLDAPRWATLSHAYGPATDIPDLLASARHDTRPGHQHGAPWFKLWSALCHQGDVYTASYAALPHILAAASEHLTAGRYDPLLLATSIELAHLEGRGPPIPSDLVESYSEALREARLLVEQQASVTADSHSQAVLWSSAAVLAGDVARARAILDADLGDAGWTSMVMPEE